MTGKHKQTHPVRNGGFSNGTNTPLKRKVLVAMSGGVDSSVAAALLVREDYDVTGAFMVNYDEEDDLVSCWVGDYYDAVRVAAKLGIPLIKLNFTKEYKKSVLDYMYKEYESGRTPNPDVLCNKFIKFGAWLDKARKLGFDYLATGHYAKVMKDPSISPLRKGRSIDPSLRRRGLGGGQVHLRMARDSNKDQTYFLHQLNQKQLKHVLFPIGEYTKADVRALAKKFGLPTADKEESMGICFVGEVPMKQFLQKKIKPKSGKIIDSSGKVIGSHDGLAFYTIGERGLGINLGARPVYVLDKNIKRNELMVGFEDDPLLYKKEISVADVSWISGHQPKFPLQCEVRLRHRQPLQRSIIDVVGTGHCPVQHAARVESRTGHCPVPTVIVEFQRPQRAVTPGQFAVFYRKGECLGGGVIT